MRAAIAHGGFTLAQTAVASFAAPSSDAVEYDYVLDCQPLAARSGLAIALSTHTLQLRSLETLALCHEFIAHKSTIREVWTSQVSPHQVATGSSDQCVKLWDTRMALAARTVPVGHEVWSLSIGWEETLLAVGTDEGALLYDVRTGATLCAYSESHVDAVTQVRFHPTQPAFVATASEDGVVCLFDSRIADEDEALESVLNVESAVTTLGFFGPALENVYCLTGTETLDLWNIWTAERLHHYDTIRDDCNGIGVATDYFIDCVYDSSADELFVLGGTHDGDMNAIGVGVQAASKGQLQHAAAVKGGHKACVRCLYYDKESATLYTGGEDTRLCQWTVPDTAGARTSYSRNASLSALNKKATDVDPTGIRKARKASRPY
ncbi:unnamed protein product [Hyaloperonospora brassicae]|uniref:Anaphase-promoting complex subunit 4 WD40 domain-containing protein n=1 Tax=Hyaloperonospora brassicae TaxID=162125 RepID=A0AAV0T392_HYABA|nr:unnamed protein product [Hyaloperonospora brassicae]